LSWLVRCCHLQAHPRRLGVGLVGGLCLVTETLLREGTARCPPRRFGRYPRRCSRMLVWPGGAVGSFTQQARVRTPWYPQLPPSGELRKKAGRRKSPARREGPWPTATNPRTATQGTTKTPVTGAGPPRRIRQTHDEPIAFQLPGNPKTSFSFSEKNLHKFGHSVPMNGPAITKIRGRGPATREKRKAGTVGAATTAAVIAGYRRRAPSQQRSHSRHSGRGIVPSQFDGKKRGVRPPGRRA